MCVLLVCFVVCYCCVFKMCADVHVLCVHCGCVVCVLLVCCLVCYWCVVDMCANVHVL